MKVFAISDLHLSFASNKPMDRFGDIWIRHWEKIERNWKAVVLPEDLVLVAGDHSWGLKLEAALPDLEFIASLPGRKVLSKGNHDLWWNSLAKLQRLALSDVYWLQNNAHSFGPISVAGTRGWSLPDSEFSRTEEDVQIYAREVERLKISLQALPESGTRLGMLHYPPLTREILETGFTRLFEQFGVQTVVYGHLHTGHNGRTFVGEHNGVDYRLVSCDLVGFSPVQLLEV